MPPPQEERADTGPTRSSRVFWHRERAVEPSMGSTG
jgi:hypothetical protein